MRKGILIIAGLVLGISLLTSGLYYLHSSTRDRLRDSERARIAFADIECTPPAAYDRPDFLAEVQYISHMPDQISLLDADLTQRLAEAFAKHPWVEKVDRVEITGLRQVRAKLTHRQAVLQIVRPAEPKPIPYLLDGRGMLLSQSRTLDDLPTYTDASLPAPTEGAGSVWNHPVVDRLVKTATALVPHQDRLKLKQVKLENDQIVFVTAQGSRVLWGSAPGSEAIDEARAEQKVARLLEYCRRHGDLDHPEGPQEHDVRAIDRPTHRLQKS